MGTCICQRIFVPIKSVSSPLDKAGLALQCAAWRVLAVLSKEQGVKNRKESFESSFGLLMKIRRSIDLGPEHLFQDPHLRSRIRMLAARPSEFRSILLCGPSSTGKRAFAVLVWNSAKDIKRPFVQARSSYIQSEASLKRLFDIAEGGDLFLGEIADLSPSLRNALRRLSSERTQVRLMASTKTPAQDSLSDPLFSVILSIAPLRSRKDDIRSIVAHMLRRRGMVCSPQAMEVFLQREWKGEIPELAECIFKSYCFAKKRGRLHITVEDLAWSLKCSHIDLLHFESLLQPSVQNSLVKKGLKEFLRDVEAILIFIGLADSKGCTSTLARELQIPLTTLLGRKNYLRSRLKDLEEMMN